MANIYVRSTDGLDTDTGATWALAKATLTGAAAIDAAGDTIFVSQAHAETTAASIAFAIAGTVAAPSQILAANDAAEPPTTLSTASVTTTGAGNITLTGVFYCYGIAFNCGTGATGGVRINVSNAAAAGNRQVYEACDFNIPETGVGNLLRIGNASPVNADAEFINCRFRVGVNSTQIQVIARTRITGGSWISGTTTPTTIFTTILGGPYDLVVENHDFSNLGAAVNLFAGGAAVTHGKAVFRNCKLPATWTGSLWSSTPTNPGLRAEMYNCDSTDTNYRLWVEDYAGSTKSETIVIRTGGASDGTTGLSWKMVSSANARYPTVKLESPEIMQWNSTLTALTATVEIVHDINVVGGQGAGTGSRFQDDEIWLEVMYLGTTGFPLGTWIRDSKANVLAAAADQTDSTEAWTTTGLTTPQTQKLSVTFTPAKIGYIVARVVVAKAGKTIYVCPKLTVA